MTAQPEFIERRKRPRNPKTRGGWRRYDIGLDDPEACPTHGSAFSYVVNTIRHGGFIERRHQCRECDWKWPSYQTKLDPRRPLILHKFALFLAYCNKIR